VSIVMPTYRRSHLIGATIQSLLAQTFTDFELLVRDDGTEGDGTEAAVRAAAAGDRRVVYHRNSTSLRMPGNLNAGIRASRGDYVVICHDHDIFEPQYVATLVKLLDDHPSALYAHCGITMIDQHGTLAGARFVGEWPALSSGEVWVERMLRSFACPVCALSMVRRSAHEKYGLYEPTFGIFADVDLWIRLAHHGDVAYAASSLIRVRTRETDHVLAVDPWPQLASVFAIHRHHIASNFVGTERLHRELIFGTRADYSVLRTALFELRRTRRLTLGPSADRLRRNAGPIGRLVAHFAA
jgi:glycosyltransferase involved in cell wall biosynthesis